jgi:hypothetical protein
MPLDELEAPLAMAKQADFLSLSPRAALGVRGGRAPMVELEPQDERTIR